LLPLALAAALLSPAARASAEIRVDGSYRLRFAQNTDFALDDRGLLLGQHGWLENRLRLSPKVVDRGEEASIEVQAQFDIFDGLLAGDLAPTFQGLGWDARSQHLSLDRSGFDFRALFVELQLPIGLFQLGQMPERWGMGLVFNSGNEEEAPDFGDVRFGDIVERILFASRPLPKLLGTRAPLAQQIAIGLGADLVYRDRLATLIQRNGGATEWGDTAFQLDLFASWTPSESTRVSFEAVRRVQQFAKDNSNLHSWTFDAYARWAASFPAQELTLAFEGEGAAITGGTSHATDLSSPGSVRLSQQGFALRGRAGLPGVEAELEVGFASGRENPFDDSAKAFTFNRDYKVGLVLWDEVMLFQTQNAAARLASPSFLGRPVNGVDLIPTEGAVTDALYLKPTVRFRPGLFRGKVRLVGSLLWARAPEPVVDAWQALTSSAPRNAFGAPAGQQYGVELDGAVTWRERLYEQLGLELGAQYGILFPGDVFDRPDGTRLGKVVAVKLRAGVQF
jgi:hypothetical protein